MITLKNYKLLNKVENLQKIQWKYMVKWSSTTTSQIKSVCFIIWDFIIRPEGKIYGMYYQKPSILRTVYEILLWQSLKGGTILFNDRLMKNEDVSSMSQGISMKALVLHLKSRTNSRKMHGS
jgi:hypothetical protein